MPMPMPTPVECCGKPRTSPFCPDCGNKLESDDPLVGLLVSCRRSERAHRASARRWREKLGQPGEETWKEFHEDQAAESDAKAAEWKARADALADLIERDRSAQAD